MGLVIITVNVELMTDAYKVFSITPDLLSGKGNVLDAQFIISMNITVCQHGLAKASKLHLIHPRLGYLTDHDFILLYLNQVHSLLSGVPLVFFVFFLVLN